MAALAALAGASLLPQQGGTIYRSGSESLAFPGESTIGIPSRSLPCASCHGLGAEGAREGGVSAPTIDEASLLAATPLRPSYDPQGFAGAVRDGVSPDGRRFNPIMPRYKLTSGELAALWAHLGQVAAQQRRGVGPREVRFGILVKPEDEERGRKMVQVAQQAWTANASPVFGRNVRFELVVAGDASPLSLASRAAAADVLACLPC